MDYQYQGQLDSPTIDRITATLGQKAAEIQSQQVPMLAANSLMPPQLMQQVNQGMPQESHALQIAKKMQTPEGGPAKKWLELTAGKDPEQQASLIQHVADHPEEIDLNNAYQRNVVGAQWLQQQAQQPQTTVPEMPNLFQLHGQDLANVMSGKGSNLLGLQQGAAKHIADLQLRKAESDRYTAMASGVIGNNKLPASIQVANEIEKAQAGLDAATQSGDVNTARQFQQRITDLKQSQKIIKLGEGVDMSGGNASEIPNYGNIVGGIKGTEKKLETTGTAQGSAITNLGNIIDNSNTLETQIQGVLNHPGKSKSLGAKSYFPTVRGTDAFDFESRLAQIGGGAFLKQYNQLRGGGAITEIEGQKGTEAIDRMKSAQSEDQFNQAGQDLLSIVQMGKQRALLQSQGQFGAENPVSPGGKKAGGVLHRDANGNKAIVYPDGSYEEVP